jgi:hypothetical protein
MRQRRAGRRMSCELRRVGVGRRFGRRRTASHTAARQRRASRGRCAALPRAGVRNSPSARSWETGFESTGGLRTQRPLRRLEDPDGCQRVREGADVQDTVAKMTDGAVAVVRTLGVPDQNIQPS